MNLILIPFHQKTEGWGAAFATLELMPAPALFSELVRLQSFPVPERFETLVSTDGPEELDTSRTGTTQTDGLGNPLCWVSLRELLPFRSHPEVQKIAHNRVAWATLGAYPPETKIVLYWR